MRLAFAEGEGSYWCVVLHDGVVQLVSLGGAACEEARLTDVDVELLQTAVPVAVNKNIHNKSRL